MLCGRGGGRAPDLPGIPPKGSTVKTMWATVQMLALFWALCPVLAVTPGNNTGAIPCQAGNFTAGDNAAITCVFGQKIENSIHNVFVTQYSFHDAYNFTDVIKCFRLRDKEFTCQEEDGYKYREVFGNNFTFEIPRVTKRFAGRYSCSLVPPDIVPQDLCFLYVNEAEADTHETTCKEARADDVSKNVFLWLFLITLALLACFVILYAKPFIARRYRSAHPEEPKTEELQVRTSNQQDAQGAKDETTLWGRLKERLPSQAISCLIEHGFDDDRVLKHASTEDFNEINLLRGHRIVVLQELNRIRPRTGKRRMRSFSGRNSAPSQDTGDEEASSEGTGSLMSKKKDSSSSKDRGYETEGLLGAKTDPHEAKAKATTVWPTENIETPSDDYSQNDSLSTDHTFFANN